MRDNFRQSLRGTFTFSGVQLTTFITGAMAVVMGMVYFGPEDLFRRPLPPSQTSIVMTVQHIGPVWAVLFVGMGIGLISAVTLRRYIVLAHILALFGWTFYGIAIILGAALSEPPSPIVTGVMAIGVAAIHWGLLQAHQDAGEA